MLFGALFSNSLKMGSDLISTNAGSYLGVGQSVWNMIANYSNAVMQHNAHNMLPSSVEGQLNSGDVNTACGKNTFHFYKMSVKQEFAKIIDDYFSTFGYKVNIVKTPNITGRENWNYVKLLNPNIEGTEIPEFELDEYKKQLEAGITFWHNPQTFRDYSQSNNIVT